MGIDVLHVEKLKDDIYQVDLALKSLIQEIYRCEGPLDVLNDLNTKGRCQLSELKSLIEELETYGKERRNDEITLDATDLKDQYFNTFSMFRKANVACMLAIDKLNKTALFSQDDKDSLVRQRHTKDKVNLVKMSSNVTEQLLSISRHLADTTELSANTLNTLASSSTTVAGTVVELQETKSLLFQSGKLLAKYSRRAFTDKLLLLLGFAFFIACVLYVLKKRVF